METCAIEECGKPKRKRGWCEMHYSRFKAHGTPYAPGRNVAGLICLWPDCEDLPVAKGQCKSHYYANRRLREQIKKGQALSYGPKPYSIAQIQHSSWRGDLQKTCSVSACKAAAKTRGYCGAHYQRMRRFGSPDFTPPEANKTCKIADCQRVTNARGLCDAHYYRWKKYGDAEATPVRKAGIVQPLPPRACLTCGELFEPGISQTRKYCGRKCAPKRRGGSVNRRAVVERLGKRDGWICHLCKLPVKKDLYWPNGQAGSVDHIVTVFHGGSDEDSNLALAHLTCNTARGRKEIL